MPWRLEDHRPGLVVEVLYVEHCPNFPAALALVERTHQSKLTPSSRLAWARPTRSLPRRERKICRWPASWPTKAIWVNTTAR